jgi:U4/U6 small nuclear ribonucleoprotein SNU13
MSAFSPKAYPMADENFSAQIFDLIELAREFNQIKKGANESTKVLKKGLVELVVIAADTEPLEIILHLPLLCEDKNVPYIFIPSKKILGQACGVQSSVIACSILTKYDSSIIRQIKIVKEKIEYILA